MQVSSGRALAFLGRVPSPVPGGFAIAVWEREPMSAPRVLV